MANLNDVTLVGRLTNKPELEYTPNGHARGRFSIAVDRPTKKDGSHEVDFINVRCWDKIAESVAKYMDKGRLVLVKGRIQVDHYKDQNDQPRVAVYVLAFNVQFLDRKPGSAEAEAAEADVDEAPVAAGAEDEDVPF